MTDKEIKENADNAYEMSSGEAFGGVVRFYLEQGKKIDDIILEIKRLKRIIVRLKRKK
jgi:hypothetical protein